MRPWPAGMQAGLRSSGALASNAKNRWASSVAWLAGSRGKAAAGTHVQCLEHHGHDRPCHVGGARVRSQLVQAGHHPARQEEAGWVKAGQGRTRWGLPACRLPATCPLTCTLPIQPATACCLPPWNPCPTSASAAARTARVRALPGTPPAAASRQLSRFGRGASGRPTGPPD